ncbi:MAG TPA: SDR family oxidoreductase [Nitrososphaerales archaeon]|nr:SDR family oxidoreductase [Nitrososphaerales archaeon]
MKLRGKVAIVTGAGVGIGKSIALKFAEEGAKLAINSRTRSKIEETARGIRSLGAEVLVRTTDVSVSEEVESFVNDTHKEFGRVDVLVNNAGVLGPVGVAAENDVASWIHTIDVNLVGTFLCCRKVLPIMMRQRGGSIINMSGGGATLPYPRFSAYATSKAGVVGLTQTLAEEVKDHNVRVNAIAPGLTNTRLQDEILAAGDLAGERATMRAREAKEKGGADPLRAANLAVFLASDESVRITGRLISAVWDDWENLADRNRQNDLVSSELYTLRRIDGMFFAPIKRDVQK